ncbi:MAG: AbrB/MazE/SpoVT family DNA-binding domain-containing protein [Arachnia sp.]
MSTGTVTSKGQITIPKEVREALGLKAGSRVTFARNEDGVYELDVERRSVKDLAGSLAYAGLPKSVEEMDQAIAAATAEGLR